ncbi:hypothetical protein pb186bvf_019033 [Paramecium bursaria]
MSTEQTPSNIYPTFHPPQNQNPNQPYIIYVPQIVYPNQQADEQPQVQTQPQQIYSQMQQPLIAQQPYINIQGDAQQYGYVPVEHEHKIIKDSSVKDKHNLAFKATGLLFITSLVSLVLLIILNCTYKLRREQYEFYYRQFYFPFYSFLAIFVSIVIHTFKNIQKVRNGRADLISYVIFTISFALICQGAFPSGFTRYYSSYDYYYFTLWTMYALGQACITLAGILQYIKTEKNELNHQESAFRIVFPNLVYTIILFAYNIDNTFVLISFICSIVFGFYYIFVLKSFLSKGYVFYHILTSLLEGHEDQ